MNETLISVIYDGINNSVFEGQVLQPLRKKAQQYRIKKIVIISFEYKTVSEVTRNKILSLTPNIELIILKKFTFLGTWSLLPAIYKLKKVLNYFKHYKLFARGPFASFTCAAALDKTYCSSFVMQARGLAADEYLYSKKKEKNHLKKLIYWYRIKQLRSLEKKAYQNPIGTIESVSSALQQYLINTLEIQKKRITVAQDDIPKKFEPAQVALWKREVRTQLHIKPSDHVYCFNGSAKPWQCPDDVVQFFLKQYTQNRNCFLLVLTQDVATFQKLIKLYVIPEQSYCVLHVPHEDMYRYLSACDTGLIFREQHIINWIARPTKVLEYQAVGLNIAHNNTVEMLMQKKSKN